MTCRAWPLEPTIRRFVTGLVGLVLGAFACLLDHYLLVDLPFDLRQPLSASGPFFDAVGQPEWLAFLAHFGLMFIVVRWSQQTNLQRDSRVRVGLLAWVGFLTWSLNFLAGFPQPWGIFVAVVISLSVQLATPWRARISPPATPGQWVRV